MTPIIDKNYQSSNFDDRKLPISILVLHYTGLSFEDSLQKLCDQTSSNRVSAHYLLREDGVLFQLVDEEKRAWHAGVSFWRGISDVNSASVGVEIVNSGYRPDGTMPPYTQSQMDSLAWLAREVVQKFGIRPWCVIGHSDIAPGRKIDPGALNWEWLASQNVGIWPAGQATNDDCHAWKGTPEDVRLLQKGLLRIGYMLDINGQLDARTTSTLKAFQHHFRQAKTDGVPDAETFRLIQALLAIVPDWEPIA